MSQIKPPNDDPYTMATANPTIETAYKPKRETLKTLTYSLYLTFVPHRRNSPTRKYLTLIVFIAWAVTTVVRQFGFGEGNDQIYWVMTVIVVSIVSHLWGFEYGVLSTVTKDFDDDD